MPEFSEVIRTDTRELTRNEIDAVSGGQNDVYHAVTEGPKLVVAAIACLINSLSTKC